MTTPAPARRWVGLLLVAGLAFLAFGWVRLDAQDLDAGVAVALAVGAAASVLFPIRYRLGSSTHGLTLDQAMLLAMLVALPPGWAPVVHAAGVASGHLARRTPSIRLAYNVGSTATVSSVSTFLYVAIAGSAAPFSTSGLVAFGAAALAYAVLSAILIAILFERLGVSTIAEGLADVAPVSRVAVPANVVAGGLLGWLASDGAGFAAIGVGLVVVLFVAYRTWIGARLARERASRLREVSTALVGASGSFAKFDMALQAISDLFDAEGAELLLRAGDHRRVGRDRWDGRSWAATAGLGMEEPTAFAPGTDEGGQDGALVAPLVSGNSTVGAIVVHGRRGIEFWDDADEDVLAGVAGEVVVALENQDLLRELDGERSRLASQSELLSGILTAASDGIALLAVDGAILSWNPGMANITGMGGDGSQVIGKGWTDLLHVRDPDEADESSTSTSLARAVALASNGSPQDRTWRLVDAGGQERWVRAQLTASRAGDLDAVVLIMRDVTAAREVDRMKADFIATVSHELRTPLTPLKGFLELVQTRTMEPEQQKQMHDSMHRQVQRLEALVGDLLSISELDQQMVDLARVEVPLAEVLGRIQERYRDTNRVIASRTSTTVVGDADALVRILDALVSNGLKHAEGPVSVSVRTQGTLALVEVTDNGPGIAKADQEAIFERFHRLGDHLHRTQGPGLGLAIARALARHLGGDVVVRSRPGEGATFALQLPLVA